MLKHSLCCLCVGLIISSGPQEPKSKPAQANRSAKQHNANSQPSTTPLNNPSAQIDNPANAASSSESQKGDAKDDAFKTEQLRQNRIIVRATVWIAIFSGLSFAAVAVYSIVSYKQWEAMKGQAESMDESVVYGLRAYVGIHSVGISQAKTRLYIQIQNVGKRPAEKIKVIGEARFTIPDKPVMILPLSRDFGRARLFAGAHRINMVFEIDKVLSGEQIQSLLTKNPEIIVSGNINFMDGFHKDKNSPFALRYDRVDDRWFSEPIPETDATSQK